MNTIRYSEGTDTVINLASQLESSSDSFFREYTNLYTLIENDLAAAWKGEDFDALKARTNEEKHFYESMRDVINEYATFLRNTANAHEARKDDSKDQAQNVTFG